MIKITPTRNICHPLFSKLVLVIKEHLFYNKIAALVLPPKNPRGKELFRIVSTKQKQIAAAFTPRSIASFIHHTTCPHDHTLPSLAVVQKSRGQVPPLLDLERLGPALRVNLCTGQKCPDIVFR